MCMKGTNDSLSYLGLEVYGHITLESGYSGTAYMWRCDYDVASLALPFFNIQLWKLGVAWGWGYSISILQTCTHWSIDIPHYTDALCQIIVSTELLYYTSASVSPALVVLTSLGGYIMAPGVVNPGTLLWAMAGTALCSASANSFNQWMEVPYDSLMTRTKNRVLVRKLIRYITGWLGVPFQLSVVTTVCFLLLISLILYLPTPPSVSFLSLPLPLTHSHREL